MTPAQAPVVVVGGGPVGLTLALRLAGLGVDVTVLEAGERLRGEGSKALCMQKETLESWTRLGIGEDVVRRGVAWTLGRTYFRGTELFTTRFAELGRDAFPPFVNVSQTEVEELLVRACEASPSVDLRWSHRVEGLDQTADDVTLHVAGPDGAVDVHGRYVVAADGARSTVRDLLGIGFPGRSHDDRFLIADVRADLPFPDERRFWFDPPWNPGRTVLVHPQPDSVWRIDWQVPADLDLEAERSSGRLEERIRRIVGMRSYEVVWLSLYRFHQRVADRFSRGRVLLAGDSAHLVSPFGARGLNSGVADAENLAWKLAHVVQERAPGALLDTYGAERRAAAQENLAVTDATMRFLVPPDRLARLRRNALLRSSRWVPPLRRRVDSGRLAAPHRYAPSAVVEPGGGDVVPDGPVTVLAGTSTATRLRELVDADVVGLLVLVGEGDVTIDPDELPRTRTPLVVVVPPGAAVPAAPPPGAVVVQDDSEALVPALAGPPPTTRSRLLVVRPDWHVAARRDVTTPVDVAALDGVADRAVGRHLDD